MGKFLSLFTAIRSRFVFDLERDERWQICTTSGQTGPFCPALLFGAMETALIVAGVKPPQIDGLDKGMRVFETN
jgi:hypothetical protein